MTPGSPAQGEQAQASEEAKLSNPGAVAEREASRTKFSGLNTEQATNADGEAFPGVVDEPAGGPPKLSAGESVTAYPADNVAQLLLPGGKLGVLESLQPIAVRTGPGQRVPVNLGLRDAGSAFEPATPVVGVSIPKQLGSGVSLSGIGVSLTLVDGSGAALGSSEGAIDGASVLYPNTQTDTDTVIKPTTLGFEVDMVLRSVDSPQQLYFRVGMPEGASLVAAKDGSGNVEVVDEGATLAVIPVLSAHDAAGTAVPVSMSVAGGDVLALSVASHEKEYQWPVVVDPAIDTQFFNEVGHKTNWHFVHEGGSFTAPEHPEGSGWTESIAGSHSASEWGGLFYTTRGESQIVELGSVR